MCFSAYESKMKRELLKNYLRKIANPVHTFRDFTSHPYTYGCVTSTKGQDKRNALVECVDTQIYSEALAITLKHL